MGEKRQLSKRPFSDLRGSCSRKEKRKEGRALPALVDEEEKFIAFEMRREKGKTNLVAEKGNRILARNRKKTRNTSIS